MIPGRADVGDQCVQNINRLKPQADHYGLPLMIEPLVFQPNTKAGGYMVDGDPDKIIPLVRQAVELGADIIKADPTDDVSVYRRVIKVAGDVPVLVRGGGRATEREILVRTRALMDEGASGIVYGRNIIQHPNPAGITRALMAVVHEGASVEAALDLVRGSA
jgi:DhnA family fructose-bisphosphate aldolase class Ia